jgi:membrane-bound lytic murein transglycosylase D
MRVTIKRTVKRQAIQASVASVAALGAISLMSRDAYVAPVTSHVVAPAPSMSVVGTSDGAIEEVAAAPITRAITRAPFARTPIGAASMRATGGLPNLEHQLVQTWIKRFTTTQRGSMATYLRRKGQYEDMITRKLAARGMPEGLVYLAMIESGFNPKAKSPVKASGLWQFMSPTAREYGLTVSRRVDERNNPVRSTDAALKYLDRLHDRFGSWYLAAAAYNTGQGRVARVMKQVTGKERGTDEDYYRIAPRLSQETRDYVPKMIAAARIGNNPERYGFRAD